MTTTNLILIGVDLVAVTVLTLGIYYPRHRRRDLVVAFLGVNVGVLAVAEIFATAEVGLGIGLGLFGVLSIIRLRSSEISQREVAYYFSVLAMGLIGGLASNSVLVPATLLGLILVVMWAADHPALLSRSRHHTVKVGRAIADEAELREELERMLGADVTALHVKQLDLVGGTTSVDVRFRLNPEKRSEIPDPVAVAPSVQPAPPVQSEIRIPSEEPPRIVPTERESPTGHADRTPVRSAPPRSPAHL